MASPFGPLPGLFRAPVVRLLVVAALVGGLFGTFTSPARAADARLEEARERRADIATELEQVNRELEASLGAVEEAETRLSRLRDRADEHEKEADVSAARRAERARASYIAGQGDPLLEMLAAEDTEELLEQARLMAWASAASREDFERADAAATETSALAERSAELAEVLKKRSATLKEKQQEAEELLAEAKEAEEEVQREIAREKAAAARRAAQAAASRASRSASTATTGGGSGDGGSGGGSSGSGSSAGGGSGGGGSTASAPATGGLACPVGQPRTYIDSWGAPRSGGRSHKGTDILAPGGTPTPAIENGVISRMSSNSLGGISLYLRGNSGNLYYYTHLSGYAGVAVGQSVSAGQTIAYVGATGNARGINHLHFEVRPGGGGSVNPYPYVRRACG